MEAYLAPIQYHEHVSASDRLGGHPKTYHCGLSLGFFQCVEIEFGQLNTNRLALAERLLRIWHACKGIMEPEVKSMSPCSQLRK